MKSSKSRDFPGGSVVKGLPPLQRERVTSLIRELRSHRLREVAKKKKNQKKQKTEASHITCQGFYILAQSSELEVFIYSTPGF